MGSGIIYFVDFANGKQLAQVDTMCRAYEDFAASGDTTLVSLSVAAPGRWVFLILLVPC